MKYIKNFEDISLPSNDYYYFKDEKLIVHKIFNGPNQDKIFFRFYNEEHENFSDKCSMMLGCTKILNTEYENIEKIRNMELGGSKFRKVHQNTYNTIFNYFLEKFGYNSDEVRYVKRRQPYRKWESYFKAELQKIATDAKDLGDVLDGLKKYKKDIYDLMEIEKFRLETDVKKYNM